MIVMPSVACYFFLVIPLFIYLSCPLIVIVIKRLKFLFSFDTYYHG